MYGLRYSPHGSTDFRAMRAMEPFHGSTPLHVNPGSFPDQSKNRHRFPASRKKRTPPRKKEVQAIAGPSIIVDSIAIRPQPFEFFLF